MPKFHIIHFILLYVFSFQQIVAQNSVQMNDEQNTEIEKLLSEAQLNFQTDVEKSLSLAQKAETKLTKSDNLTDKAKVFTLLGNIYGLKKDRTDKAADYHNKAFQIYNQLFKAKQITGKHFYTFFSENVAPIYELISSENYNKRRRDKIAIRKYQELYTELSRFFLNEGFKEVESPNVDKIVQKKKTFVTNNTQLEEKVTRQIEFNLLGGKLLQLYDSYINALEKKFGEKDASINDLKKDFMEKKKQIEKEMEMLNLAIVEKDSIILQDSLLFKQKMDLLLAKQKIKNADFQIQSIRYQRNLISALLAVALLLVICGAIYWNYRQSKKQQKIILDKNTKLTKINEELDHFAYKVSHDLRSPLASTIGLIYISKEEKDMDKLQSYILLMEKSLKKLDEFISDMLAHSRNTRTEVAIEEINIEGLLEDIVNQHQFDEDTKNKVRIVIDIKSEGQVLYSDEYRLTLIFNNLIANAIRYADKHKDDSFLKISGEINKQNAFVKIEDNGLGIAEEHLAKVFEMFYRANDSIKGSGLGLYIVKQSIDKLGGTIALSSQLGEGTCFEIQVPNFPVN